MFDSQPEAAAAEAWRGCDLLYALDTISLCPGDFGEGTIEGERESWPDALAPGGDSRDILEEWGDLGDCIMEAWWLRLTCLIRLDSVLG